MTWLRRLIDRPRPVRGSPHLDACTAPKCRNDSSRRGQTTWTSTNDGNVHGLLSGGFKRSHADSVQQSSQLPPRLAAFDEIEYQRGFIKIHAKTFTLRSYPDLLRLDQSLKKPIKKLSETGLVRLHPWPFRLAVMQGLSFPGTFIGMHLLVTYTHLMD